MKDTIKLRIQPDGSIDCIYDDDLVTLLGGEAAQVCRASNVEWLVIDGRSGWTVRSAKDPDLALRTFDWCRWRPSYLGTIVTFQTREEALKEEVKFFWELFEPIREEIEWAQKGWETNPCPVHGVIGCVWCRYGDGMEPRRRCRICKALPGQPCDAGLHS
jgi:hypothetical protein